MTAPSRHVCGWKTRPKRSASRLASVPPHNNFVVECLFPPIRRKFCFPLVHWGVCIQTEPTQVNRFLSRLSLILLLCLAVAATAQTALKAKSATPQRPLTALPYTPSLDIPSMDKTVDPCTNFYAYSCG